MSYPSLVLIVVVVSLNATRKISDLDTHHTANVHTSKESIGVGSAIAKQAISAVFAAVDQPCDDQEPCQPTLLCFEAFPGTSRYCVDLNEKHQREKGEKCHEASQCKEAFECQQAGDLLPYGYCFEVKAKDEQCARETFDVCAATGLSCMKEHDSVESWGYCRFRRKDEECDSTYPCDAAAGLDCKDGTCHGSQQEGNPCDDNRGCDAGLACTQGWEDNSDTRCNSGKNDKRKGQRCFGKHDCARRRGGIHCERNNNVGSSGWCRP